jgi:hypothetical protein
LEVVEDARAGRRLIPDHAPRLQHGLDEFIAWCSWIRRAVTCPLSGVIPASPGRRREGPHTPPCRQRIWLTSVEEGRWRIAGHLFGAFRMSRFVAVGSGEPAAVHRFCDDQGSTV